MAVVHPNNPQAQEELIALFARNLNFDSQQPTPAPAPAPVPVTATVPTPEEKIVYISQHYNHSSHIARHDVHVTQQQSSRPASEPPQGEHSAIESVLREYGVNTSGLSSAQLQLFKTVDDAQKMHLIDLWRICPPTNSNDNPTLAWSMTSVSQEEILAKLRYEQRQQQQQQQQQQVDTPILSLDGTPIQAGDGRWGTSAAAAQSYMEPYMASGYEDMARREYEESERRAAFFAEAMMQTRQKDAYSSSHFAIATAGPTYNPAHADPVYNVSTVDWRRQEAMADQYGRMMALRGGGDEEML